jgi:putative tryptophan/tyrosine transport system substrate-binding protein
VERRGFITFLGGAAAWPLAARAQQPQRVRRVGVLMAYGDGDPYARALLAVFAQGLSDLGWVEGHNLRIDVRWARDSTDRMLALGKELIDLQPDVILANTTPATAALKRQTPTIPIVFAIVADPVGSGFVGSLARPGGNITGFSNIEASMMSKWLELLTEMAPRLNRAAMIFNPDTAPYIQSFLSSVEAAARALNVDPIAAPVHNDAEIEAGITALGREPNGGLLVMPDNFVAIHRASIISLAARNNVPAIYQTLFMSEKAGCFLTGQTIEIYFIALRAM